MNNGKSLSTPLQRITVIDALRGFSLLGVLLVHMQQRFSIRTGQREQLLPMLDDIVRQLISNVFSGKFILIFGFLFGLSFFIQMDRAQKKGIEFHKRFLWRMAILFSLGIFGTLFYANDIITIYAVFGVVLLCIYRLKNWALVTIICLLMLGMPRFLILGYESIVKTEQVENVQPSSGRSSENVRQSNQNNVEKPTFLSDAKIKLTRGMVTKLTREFGYSGRAYPTLALFILGFLVGRFRFFEEVHFRKKRNLIIFAGCIVAVIVLKYIIGLFPAQSMFRRPSELTLSYFFLSPLNDIYRMVYAGALAMGFIIIYHTKIGGKCLDIMMPLGRTGLTNYMMQSIIGCLIFSMWAFGSIFGTWGITETFALGLVIYTIQIIVSKYWLKYYLYGPFEWFWRSATYFKWQPLRK